MSGQPSSSRSAAIELQFQPACCAPERAVAFSNVWSGRWRSSVLPEAMSSHQLDRDRAGRAGPAEADGNRRVLVEEVPLRVGAGRVEVGPAVAVEVRPGAGHAVGARLRAGLLRDVLEALAAVVAVEVLQAEVVGREQVLVAVLVVVLEERRERPARHAREAPGVRGVGEVAVAVVQVEEVLAAVVGVERRVGHLACSSRRSRRRRGRGRRRRRRRRRRPSARWRAPRSRRRRSSPRTCRRRGCGRGARGRRRSSRRGPDSRRRRRRPRRRRSRGCPRSRTSRGPAFSVTSVKCPCPSLR